jgi:hypothetical protein
VQPFAGEGVLRYRSDWWATIEVAGDIADYYRKLLPKEWNVVPGRAAHITVVRGEKPTIEGPWKSREGQVIRFFYEPGLKWNDHHY